MFDQNNFHDFKGNLLIWLTISCFTLSTIHERQDEMHSDLLVINEISCIQEMTYEYSN